MEEWGISHGCMKEYIETLEEWEWKHECMEGRGGVI
jgi:hypothetical protein